MDDKSLKLLQALAPRAGKRSTDQLIGTLLGQVLEPKPDPTDQLRELYAQSKIDAGDWKGAYDAMQADPGSLQQLFQGGGSGMSMPGQEAIDQAFSERTAGETDTAKLMQFAEMTPQQKKKFLDFKGKSKTKQWLEDLPESFHGYDRSLKTGIQKDLKRMSGYTSIQDQEDAFLKDLLSR